MPHIRQANNFHHYPHKQHGAALMVMLVIMVMGTAAFLVSSLSKSALGTVRQETTSAALAQAKEALIGFSVKVTVSSSDIVCADSPTYINPNCPRPGDLPCPDMDNDGEAESNCGDASGSNQYKRLGRLPWKTLGLTDLRDGSGERLWYAVSNNFKNSTRTKCSNSNLTGCLNSDTPGTITIFASDGSLLNDGGGTSGAVAVIIAPGEVLQRTDESTVQDRSSSGSNDPLNYLEVFNDYLDNINSNYPHTLINEDNANFSDSSAANGFIQGEIKLRSGLPSDSDRVILNDQLLVITHDSIMQPIQKRVAAEVKNCLVEYAAIPQNRGSSPNQGYYPWATARTISGGLAIYNDADRLEFGHVPDFPFAQTCSDTGGSNCSLIQSGGMKNDWGTTCTLNKDNWWVNWKEMVFYGFARSLRPHLHSGVLLNSHVCPGSTCLTVNPPSSANDKSFVVIVAGKKLGTQVRSNDDLSNYLEGINLDGASPFEQSPVSSTFNDITVFQ